MTNRKSINTIVALIGAYVAAQAIADVAATKMVTMAGITLPAGSIMFAFTFTIRDLIHKRLGRDWAIAAIFTAAGINVVQAIYLYAMAAMPAPDFYPFAEAWSAIFAIVPAITIGSIVAEVVSEWVDTLVYHSWWTRLVLQRNWPQWTAVLGSNAVSLPLDSLIFGTLAFVWLPSVFGGEPLPFTAAMTIVGGQIVWKAAVTLVSMPAIYLVPRRLVQAQLWEA